MNRIVSLTKFYNSYGLVNQNRFLYFACVCICFLFLISFLQEHSKNLIIYNLGMIIISGKIPRSCLSAYHYRLWKRQNIFVHEYYPTIVFVISWVKWIWRDMSIMNNIWINKCRIENECELCDIRIFNVHDVSISVFYVFFSYVDIDRSINIIEQCTKS